MAKKCEMILTPNMLFTHETNYECATSGESSTYSFTYFMSTDVFTDHR